jgi:hypothetical protein
MVELTWKNSVCNCLIVFLKENNFNQITPHSKLELKEQKENRSYRFRGRRDATRTPIQKAA